ncbi:MAG: hypothetical protein M1828_006807 [Chrysothrix sp. TS-e1954]|nr:MAG: hypothetical protein M1828_006807 [Chrysothrix sp. TS-e1954]
MFQNQAHSGPRSGTLGSGRLQNGKIANAGWNYGGGMAGAPGPQSTSATRIGSANFSSFAQTTGGSQTHTPLDPSPNMASPSWAQVLAKDSSQKVGEYRAVLEKADSPARDEQAHERTPSITDTEDDQVLTHDDPPNREFPSLSGTPQTHQQPPQSQAIWNNTGLRGPQQAPVQRPQGQPSTDILNAPQSVGPSQPRQHQTDSQSESQTLPFPQLSSGIDDFRFEDQNNMSRLPRVPNQQGSEDDFPPLGGLGDVDGTHSRRSVPIPNPTFAGLGGSNDFGPPSQQSRSGFLGRVNSQPDNTGTLNTNARMASPTGVTSGKSHSGRSMELLLSLIREATSRSPLDQRSEEHPPPQRAEQLVTSGRLPPGMGQERYGLQSGGIPFRPSQTGIPQQQNLPTPQSRSEPDTPPTDNSQMSDKDKWGLKGLMATLRGENGTDQMNLALGMDLTTLGLDLHKPDNSPLYETWGGPFADPNARPLVRDFTLPLAYNVNNVPPLASKIGSFSDETLFAIFYQSPRDVAQDLAANELYNRDWRWHKKLQQWMMKAKELGEPQMLQSMKEERGWYYFFDVNNWRRERMGLVGYSDSEEDSDTGASTELKQFSTVSSNAPPIDRSQPRSRKIVNRSDPHKVGVKLPSAWEESADNAQAHLEPSVEGPPAKRARTDGGFGGFNSLLPAPKKPDRVLDGAARDGGDKTGGTRSRFTGRVGTISLKTGATPSFSRGGPDEVEQAASSTTYSNGDMDRDIQAQHPTTDSTQQTETEVKVVGKSTSFKPLSVLRKPAKKKKPPAEGLATNRATAASRETSSTPAKQLRPSGEIAKPKISLFPIAANDATTDFDVTEEQGEYAPLLDDINQPDPVPGDGGTADASSDRFQAPMKPTATSQSANLQELANNLGLSASERRQLFGRNSKPTDAQISQFSLAAEYTHNRELNQNEGAVPSHNPVRSIAPGKHSLQQLVNAANTQKDALEESFAAGKRNKKDAGRRYGW